MFVLVMAVGAMIAGVGIGALWVGWIVVGTFVFIGGVAAIKTISAFDLLVTFFMAVLGCVIGAQWRRRTRRWAQPPMLATVLDAGSRRGFARREDAANAVAWSASPAWSDSGSPTRSADTFAGGDSGGAGASASWNDSSGSSDSGGSDSAGSDSGGGDSGGGGGGSD